jgi:hypothetical protein
MLRFEGTYPFCGDQERPEDEAESKPDELDQIFRRHVIVSNHFHQLRFCF